MATEKSNPNYARRTLRTDRPYHPDPRRVTGGDVVALQVNREHAELEQYSAQRLDRRHILQVVKHMPTIRAARKAGRETKRIPRDVLVTVWQLCLV
ncbi:hypothetical protein EXS62_03125 [Candidatus Kaiserbacteria bacterium]|nr:hypothetical protein [Candidatus Kaiserbacteria bacterium]